MRREGRWFTGKCRKSLDGFGTILYLTGMNNETSKGPGKAYRKGMTLADLFSEFPDNATAEAWFAEQRWPDGAPACPHCGTDNVQSSAAHKTMPYRCRNKECDSRFSVKTGTVMESSNLGYQTWAIAIYLVLTSLKGVSSMKLRRDLGITQKSAWHMAHRIRAAWNGDMADLFDGPVEVDEAYFGGKERNKHADQKLHAGRGTVGKVAVAGVKDRETNRIRAAVVPTTRKRDLHKLRGGPRTAWRHALHGRAGILPGSAEPRHRQPRGGAVRERASARQRHGVILVDDEARLLRHVPPDEP